MAHLAISFVLFSCIVFVQATSFEECTGLPAPTSLRIDNCATPPCQLFRGTNVTAEWDFVITAPTTALKPKVKAYLGSIGVDFDIGQKNACDSLTNAYCPLDEGEEVTYALRMPVQSQYPKVKLNIQFSLIDDQGNKQVCFFVAAKVVDLPNVL